jgi:hypothetical protein
MINFIIRNYLVQISLLLFFYCFRKKIIRLTSIMYETILSGLILTCLYFILFSDYIFYSIFFNFYLFFSFFFIERNKHIVSNTTFVIMQQCINFKNVNEYLSKNERIN